MFNILLLKRFQTKRITSTVGNRSSLTNDNDVIGDVVAAVPIGDVTGIDSVVLLRDGVNLQGAIRQQPQSENNVTQLFEELSPSALRGTSGRTT